MCLLKELCEVIVTANEPSPHKKALKKHLDKKKPAIMSPTFFYGTSGYRMKADLLPIVVTRTAYFASLRARSMHKSIGLMITASHNPPEDNGVKVIDWSGSMLPVECEGELDAMVNVGDFDAFVKLSLSLLAENQTVLARKDTDVKVLIGTDTRESSPMLLQCAISGCEQAKVDYKIYERHTTPQLHFLVRAHNDETFADPNKYVSRFQDSINDFLKVVPLAPPERRRYVPTMYVDCANGVGALWIEKYLPGLVTAAQSPAHDTHSWPGTQVDHNNVHFFGKKTSSSVDGDKMGEWIDVRLVNDQVDMSSLLNSDCGADYVKISKKLPSGFKDIPAGTRFASLDGDADRLVYFYMEQVEDSDVYEQAPTLKLLDGDHIAALFTRFISDQLKDLGAYLAQNGREMPLTLGVVQTAYSNGNATRYFEDKLGIKPIVVKTGVKYLDPAARAFDIGVYFEANGHGTVCFSKEFHQFISSFNPSMTGEEIPRPVLLLQHFAGIINEVVGDGIADLFGVECVLRYYNWSIQDWEAETYKDLPNTQRKVTVKELSRYKTKEDIETVLISPAGLQTKIDTAVSKYRRARAFIRPSGTESIVRVYAEAPNPEQAEKLASDLSKLIH
ncbi:phosphoglucomutase/phosphomannomutase, alpha/beta/alpha domain I domain-containing protein [Ditylenchus destructor]|nr:phosphoglucomutase/phosphomannomutase, alpha/beta/alpha domain I domain-containing protein [Ditylenchus destructor]